MKAIMVLFPVAEKKRGKEGLHLAEEPSWAPDPVRFFVQNGKKVERADLVPRPLPPRQP